MLTYKDAGVNKEKGYEEVKLIKDIVKKTYSKNVLSTLGSFSGLVELGKEYENPVLVSGTDGVGTKVIIAQKMDKHNTVGIDLVAMSVNDIICVGAKPLFFLDYMAVGNLVPEKSASIVDGVAKGCIESNCSLIGGETAEMPGIYDKDEYDLAGFAVGVVEKNKIIEPKERVKENDVLIGLKSNGIHSNGYSLVRKVVFDKMGFNVNTHIDELDKSLGEELLVPTKIYVKTIVELVKKFDIHGISHITGGGFYENLPRIMPEGLTCKIDSKSFPCPKIFNLIEKWGQIDKKEMYSTFNMGIGMVIAVDESQYMEVLKEIEKINSDKAYVIGKVVKGKDIEVDF